MDWTRKSFYWTISMNVPKLENPRQISKDFSLGKCRLNEKTSFRYHPHTNFQAKKVEKGPKATQFLRSWLLLCKLNTYFFL
jgi:hypothetical protein